VIINIFFRSKVLQMKKYLWLVWISSVILLVNCSKDGGTEIPGNNDTIPEVDTPLYKNHKEWSYNLGTYEVNIRQYTQEGTFEAFEAHLPRLKEMGVGILWLMPIHPIGELNRLGSLGSYYSVKDYLDVNPEFGTMDQFIHLVKEIHDQGMFVIIDWVANHTSWDNNLTIDNPEYYNTDSEGNFQPPPGTDWSDVIDLDYSNEDLRQYMIEAMKFWIKEIKIDGFRCDAVTYVPSDFWSQANAALKAMNPGIIMLAEAERPGDFTIGFDMNYVWKLQGFDSGLMRQIYEGTKTVNDMGSYLQNEISTYPASAYRMYFTSNHDENSWHGTVFEQLGESAEVFAVLTNTMNGMPLIYSGQEAGLNKRLAFFDRDPISWTSYPFGDLYTTLLKLKKENTALWNGEAGGRPQRISTSADDKIFAYLREKNGDRMFAALNLSGENLTFNLVGDTFIGEFTNVLTEESITMNADQELTLEAWDYVVLEHNAIE
jgi:cyclomaltodextrinase / maltogenic alpha-amylase / neopullulanase